MPWLWPLRLMVPFSASGKTTSAASERPNIAVMSTAKGRIGLR